MKIRLFSTQPSSAIINEINNIFRLEGFDETEPAGDCQLSSFIIEGTEKVSFSGLRHTLSKLVHRYFMARELSEDELLKFSVLLQIGLLRSCNKTARKARKFIGDLCHNYLEDDFAQFTKIQSIASQYLSGQQDFFINFICMCWNEPDKCDAKEPWLEEWIENCKNDLSFNDSRAAFHIGSLIIASHTTDSIKEYLLVSMALISQALDLKLTETYGTH